jgi:phospholipid-binding lipoprotein MlaA
MLAACTTTNEAPAGDDNDPFEQTNRAIFHINDQLDTHVALPIAQAYVDVLPQPARSGIHNFLSNLDRPITFVNDVLQGQVTPAAQTVGRFTLNSTIGIGGLFDVAADMGIPNHDSDFGQTLGIYGVGEGPYLVLPILGPKPPRDLVGDVVDIFFDPMTYVPLREKTYWSIGRETLELVDLRAANIDNIATIKKTSVDYYATMRSLYRQHRNSLIHKDAAETQPLPDF